VSASGITTDETRVVVEFDRGSIHPGDDPIPLRIEFPARVTITDLLVVLAENQSRFFAFRGGRSSWKVCHIADDGESRVIGLVQFDNQVDDIEQALIFVAWGDPYWGWPLTKELDHRGQAPIRIRANSTHGGPIAMVRQWNSYTSAVPLTIVERPWGATCLLSAG
jgi:hypothetical protein